MHDAPSSSASQQPQWFETWFDSPYYHWLYRHRDATEAQHFMDTLTRYLNLEPGQHILDLACGKGRHAQYLHQLGYQVTGVDLSPASIEAASLKATDGLHFQVHDMRLPLEGPFDAIFNLFTSFGYFPSQQEQMQVLHNIKAALAPNGIAVIDFMNTTRVLQQLVSQEVQSIEGIDFHIQRRVHEGWIEKDIRFQHQGQDHFFQERVHALQLADFEKMFEAADLTLLAVHGDYKMRNYLSASSDRMIFLLM